MDDQLPVPLIERSKWVTFGSSFILIVVVMVVAEVLPESRSAALVSAGVRLAGISRGKLDHDAA